MTYQIQINDGQANVSLPGQPHLFNGGDVVNLTDAEYALTTETARQNTFTVLTYTPDGGGGGGTGGPEVDPIAGPALATHKTSADHDTHNDGRYSGTAHNHNAAYDATGAATGAVTTHAAAADPHGDRGHSDSALTTHVGAADPHGDRAHSDSALTTHTAALDVHGDRAYADTRIAALVNAAPAALDTLAEIDAQLASDESGTAAILATQGQHTTSIANNATAITNEVTRAEAAEGANATNLTTHINNPTGAHAGSAVSVNPSGLAVITTINVQAALAQLDAASASRVTKPASPNDGDAIIWSAAQGGYVSAKPTQELAYAEIQANYVMTGAAANVPGLSMVVPASTVPVELEIMLPVYNIQCNASGDTTVGQVAVMLWDGTNRWLYAIRFHAFSGPSQTIVDGLEIRRRLPNVAAPLTLNLQAWFIGATVTAAQIFAGNGQAANYSPAYIKAKVA